MTCCCSRFSHFFFPFSEVRVMWGFLFLFQNSWHGCHILVKWEKRQKKIIVIAHNLTICFMYFFPCCQIYTAILWSELTPHKSLNFQHMNTLLMESTKVKSRRGTNYLDCKDDSLLFFSFLRKLFLWWIRMKFSVWYLKPKLVKRMFNRYDRSYSHRSIGVPNIGFLS